MKPVMTKGKADMNLLVLSWVLFFAFQTQSLSQLEHVPSSLREAEALEEQVGPLQAKGHCTEIRLQLLCSWFIQELNENFLHKRKNTVAEQVRNINPQ